MMRITYVSLIGLGLFSNAFGESEENYKENRTFLYSDGCMIEVNLTPPTRTIDTNDPLTSNIDFPSIWSDLYLSSDLTIEDYEKEIEEHLIWIKKIEAVIESLYQYFRTTRAEIARLTESKDEKVSTLEIIKDPSKNFRSYVVPLPEQSKNEDSKYTLASYQELEKTILAWLTCYERVLVIEKAYLEKIRTQMREFEKRKKDNKSTK